MKSVAIMQPYVFPYIGYFHLISAADEFVFLDDVNFIKKGWINRNYIWSNHGPLLFTIPIIAASQNQTIHRSKIFYGEDWRERLIRQFEQNYSKAPFFPAVLAMASEVIFSGAQTISDLAITSIVSVFRYLDLPFNYRKSSDLKIEGFTGQDRILEINRHLGAKRYINAAGGRELYRKAAFEAIGIDLKFIESKKFEYLQFGKPNQQAFSIIDVLMLNDPDLVRRQFKSYSLIEAIQ